MLNVCGIIRNSVAILEQLLFLRVRIRAISASMMKNEVVAKLRAMAGINKRNGDS